MARERVQIGPAAGWIDRCYYDKHFTPKIRGEITFLLQDVQINAELGQTYGHHALRLESQRAVQERSQWRIGIEPQTQSIVLHSIKIRRGDAETEHVSLERMQFLQREAGLERFSLHGSITLLLLLEDVLPGDILEYSYTVSERPRIMPEYLTAFFSLPMGTEIGKYRFLIRHAERRALKWKASSPKFVPKITTENGEVCCYWMDVDFASPEPEACVPAWHLMFPWIQISDCPDWQTAARAVLIEWEKQSAGESVDKMVEEIANSSPDPLVRVTKAIEQVQDGFRYLSVNLEFGGGIPAAPETVVRRRYGDCKDLAFLLVHLLRGLGISARPVLVDSVLQKSVESMLPSLQMFNHAVVEYEIGNEKRWVDCTLKNQGGGALNRCIMDFGVGLPIDATSSGLAPVPKASLVSGTYDIKETFILDTSGRPSYLAMIITTTGSAADAFRHEFANAGIDGIAKNRLQSCANRFTRAARTKPLECRDDRNANEFILAEGFEIFNVVLEHQPSRTCLFQVRSEPTAGLMTGPGLAARRNPFGLPYPCHRTHTVEVEFAGLNQVAVPLFQVGNQYFTFTRRSRAWPGLLKITFSLETLTDSIPIDKVPEHRKHMEALHEAATVNLQLPIGYSHGSRKRGDFGALPLPNPSRAGAAKSVVVMTQKQMAANPGADVPAPVPETAATEKTAQLAGMAAPKPMPPAREAIQAQETVVEKPRPHRRHSRRRAGEKRSALSFCFIVLTIVAIGLAGWAYSASKAFGASLVLFVVLPVWIVSVVFAVIGWMDLVKAADRNVGDSKLFAILTFVFAVLLGAAVVPGVIHGIPNVFAGDRARGQTARSDGELLDFKNQNFVFHMPAKPWQQMDAKTFGPKTAVAFNRPDPMFFTIVAEPIELMLLDPRKHITESSKTGLRKAATSYHVVKEEEVAYNGLAGWQIETEATVQGRDSYFVQWLFATNGFGYQLTAWGPPAKKSALQDESARIFADFELVIGQRDSASSTSP